MASTSETGHAKNVANFEVLISFAQAMEPLTVHQKMRLKFRNFKLL